MATPVAEATAHITRIEFLPLGPADQWRSAGPYFLDCHQKEELRRRCRVVVAEAHNGVQSYGELWIHTIVTYPLDQLVWTDPFAVYQN